MHQSVLEAPTSTPNIRILNVGKLVMKTDFSEKKLNLQDRVLVIFSYILDQGNEKVNINGTGTYF